MFMMGFDQNSRDFAQYNKPSKKNIIAQIGTYGIHMFIFKMNQTMNQRYHR